MPGTLYIVSPLGLHAPGGAADSGNAGSKFSPTAI